MRKPIEEIDGSEEDLELDRWQYLLVQEDKDELTDEEAEELAYQRAIYAKRQETNAG